MRIAAVYEPMHQRVSLYITHEDKGEAFIAQPLTMSKKTKRFGYSEPCVVFEDKCELQSLMDDLWSMGLRPSARADEYKAQLGSMRDHLNDMRTIVFKKREDLKGMKDG